MPLSDTIINTAIPSTKPYKIQDSSGMYLLVMPNGSKYFRMNYRVNGKQQTLALGVYPQISLDAARGKRDEARQRLKSGVDSVKIQSFSTEQLQHELALRGCGVPIEQDVGQACLVNEKISNIINKYTGRSQGSMLKDVKSITTEIQKYYDAECKRRVDEELKIGWERVQADRKELDDLKQQESEKLRGIPWLISREDFMRITSCLHSDKQPESEREKFDRAFIAFRRLEPKVEDMLVTPIALYKGTGWDAVHPRYRQGKAGTKKPA